MKTLLDAGLLHGDCLTVTGKTLAENLAAVHALSRGPGHRPSAGQPAKKDSHLVILYGNLAPDRRGGQDLRQGGPAFHGHGPGVRLRRSRPGCHPRWHRGERRCGGHPLRRAQGRAGHARDAQPHRGDHGQGLGPGRRPDHRRPFLRRQPWFRGRPCHPGSGVGGRLPWCRMATITIDAEQPRSPWMCRRRAAAPQRWQPPRPQPEAASWPSTRAWSAPPPKGR